MKLTRIQLSEEKMISHGAEAKIYTTSFLDYPAVCKVRLEKSYRDPGIDNKLRKERTTQEVRLLQLLKANKIPVPWVFDVIKSTWTIVMEEIKGVPIKAVIDKIDVDSIFQSIGSYIGKIHSLDVIHGDLTTSNIIYKDDDVYFIDFGLGYISTHIEDKAVDLLVLKHTLESSHPDFYEKAYASFLQGYRQSNEMSATVEKRMSTIEGRVRYKSHGS